jgi:CRP-like cAMP-binding protein
LDIKRFENGSLVGWPRQATPEMKSESVKLMRLADSLDMRSAKPAIDITLTTDETVRLMYRQGVSFDDLVRDFGRAKVSDLLGNQGKSVSKRKIRELSKAGLKGKEIAETLGIRASSVSRVLARRKRRRNLSRV